MFIRVSKTLPPRKIATLPPSLLVGVSVWVGVGLEAVFFDRNCPRTVHMVECSGFLDLECTCYLTKKQLDSAK